MTGQLLLLPSCQLLAVIADNSISVAALGSLKRERSFSRYLACACRVLELQRQVLREGEIKATDGSSAADQAYDLCFQPHL